MSKPLPVTAYIGICATLACALLAGCQSVSDKGPGTGDGVAPDQGRADGASRDSRSADSNTGTDSQSTPDQGIEPGVIPSRITSAGAAFSGVIPANDRVTLDLEVFQADRVVMWLRKADGSQWDPSIAVLRQDNNDRIAWDDPRGTDDVHIPFRDSELANGFEFFYSGAYTLVLENKGAEDGRFQFSLQCVGGPCGAGSGDIDFDGTPDASDNCPYLANANQSDVCAAGNDPWTGLSNVDLGAAIRAARQHEVLNYVEARIHMFAWIDNVDGAVECVYTGTRVQTEEIPDPALMNTEHTWPQSRSGGDPATETDLHHLQPVTPESNTQHSNLHFGIVTEATWSVGGSKRGRDAAGDTVFEPRDVQKGNAARALFYYAVVYQQTIPANEEAVLRSWHAADPVDAREARRNQAIANIQGSRNPFIDYPHLVGRIDNF